MMGGMWGTGLWGAGWLLGAMWMLLFWGGIIALIIWAVHRLTEDHRRAQGAQTVPIDIARMRLARGEITPEQFDQLKRDLAG